MKSLSRSLVFIGCALALASCSGDDDGPDYESLFNPPPSSGYTPNNVRGFWVASLRREEGDGLFADLDLRMRISDGSLVLANRCRYPDGTVLTAGVTVGLRIDDGDTDLVTTESKDDAPRLGDRECKLHIGAGKLEYHISEGKILKFQDRGEPYPQFSTAKILPPFTKASD